MPPKADKPPKGCSRPAKAGDDPSGSSSSSSAAIAVEDQAAQSAASSYQQVPRSSFLSSSQLGQQSIFASALSAAAAAVTGSTAFPTSSSSSSSANNMQSSSSLLASRVHSTSNNNSSSSNNNSSSSSNAYNTTNNKPIAPIFLQNQQLQQRAPSTNTGSLTSFSSSPQQSPFHRLNSENSNSGFDYIANFSQSSTMAHGTGGAASGAGNVGTGAPPPPQPPPPRRLRSTSTASSATATVAPTASRGAGGLHPIFTRTRSIATAASGINSNDGFSNNDSQQQQQQYPAGVGGGGGGALGGLEEIRSSLDELSRNVVSHPHRRQQQQQQQLSQHAGRNAKGGGVGLPPGMGPVVFESSGDENENEDDDTVKAFQFFTQPLRAGARPVQRAPGTTTGSAASSATKPPRPFERMTRQESIDAGFAGDYDCTVPASQEMMMMTEDDDDGGRGGGDQIMMTQQTTTAGGNGGGGVGGGGMNNKHSYHNNPPAAPGKARAPAIAVRNGKGLEIYDFKVIMAPNANPFLPPRSWDKSKVKKTPSMKLDASAQLAHSLKFFIGLADLGEGSFSVVSRMRHRVDGCVYAIKKVKKELRNKEADFKEAQAMAASSNCEHLLRYHTSWTEELGEETYLYIQMELAWGSLQDAVEGKRPKPASDVRKAATTSSIHHHHHHHQQQQHHNRLNNTNNHQMSNIEQHHQLRADTGDAVEEHTQTGVYNNPINSMNDDDHHHPRGGGFGGRGMGSRKNAFRDNLEFSQQLSSSSQQFTHASPNAFARSINNTAKDDNAIDTSAKNHHQSGTSLYSASKNSDSDSHTNDAFMFCQQQQAQTRNSNNNMINNNMNGSCGLLLAAPPALSGRDKSRTRSRLNQEDRERVAAFEAAHADEDSSDENNNNLRQNSKSSSFSRRKALLDTSRQLFSPGGEEEEEEEDEVDEDNSNAMNGSRGGGASSSSSSSSSSDARNHGIHDLVVTGPETRPRQNHKKNQPTTSLVVDIADLQGLSAGLVVPPSSENMDALVLADDSQPPLQQHIEGAAAITGAGGGKGGSASIVTSAIDPDIKKRKRQVSLASAFKPKPVTNGTGTTGNSTTTSSSALPTNNSSSIEIDSENKGNSSLSSFSSSVVNGKQKNKKPLQQQEEEEEEEDFREVDEEDDDLHENGKKSSVDGGRRTRARIWEPSTAAATTTTTATMASKESDGSAALFTISNSATTSPIIFPNENSAGATTSSNAARDGFKVSSSSSSSSSSAATTAPENANSRVAGKTALKVDPHTTSTGTADVNGVIQAATVASSVGFLGALNKMKPTLPITTAGAIRVPVFTTRIGGGGVDGDGSAAVPGTTTNTTTTTSTTTTTAATGLFRGAAAFVREGSLASVIPEEDEALLHTANISTSGATSGNRRHAPVAAALALPAASGTQEEGVAGAGAFVGMRLFCSQSSDVGGVVVESNNNNNSASSTQQSAAPALREWEGRTGQRGGGGGGGIAAAVPSRMATTFSSNLAYRFPQPRNHADGVGNHHHTNYPSVDHRFAPADRHGGGGGGGGGGGNSASLPFHGSSLPATADEYYADEFTQMTQASAYSIDHSDGHGSLIGGGGGGAYGAAPQPRLQMTERDLLLVLQHIARALSYLHARNIAHLDVKPANILVVYKAGPGMCDRDGEWLPETCALTGIPSLDLELSRQVEMEEEAASKGHPYHHHRNTHPYNREGGADGGIALPFMDNERHPSGASSSTTSTTGVATAGRGSGNTMMTDYTNPPSRLQSSSSSSSLPQHHSQGIPKVTGLSSDRLRRIGKLLYKLGDLGQCTPALNSNKEVDEGDCRYLSRDLLNQDLVGGVNLPAADMFSLGLSVFELASGQPLPQSGDEWHALRDNPLPFEAMPQVSRDFHTLLCSLVHSDPSMRPTAEDVLHHPLVAQVDENGDLHRAVARATAAAAAAVTSAVGSYPSPVAAGLPPGRLTPSPPASSSSFGGGGGGGGEENGSTTTGIAPPTRSGTPGASSSSSSSSSSPSSASASSLFAASATESATLTGLQVTATRLLTAIYIQSTSNNHFASIEENGPMSASSTSSSSFVHVHDGSNSAFGRASDPTHLMRSTVGRNGASTSGRSSYGDGDHENNRNTAPTLNSNNYNPHTTPAPHHNETHQQQHQHPPASTAENDISLMDASHLVINLVSPDTGAAYPGSAQQRQQQQQQKQQQQQQQQGTGSYVASLDDALITESSPHFDHHHHQGGGGWTPLTNTALKGNSNPSFSSSSSDNNNHSSTERSKLTLMTDTKPRKQQIAGEEIDAGGGGEVLLKLSAQDYTLLQEMLTRLASSTAVGGLQMNNPTNCFGKFPQFMTTTAAAAAVTTASRATSPSMHRMSPSFGTGVAGNIKFSGATGVAAALGSGVNWSIVPSPSRGGGIQK